MNRQCKIIFNRTLGIWQVVSELARSRGKAGRGAIKRVLAAPLMALVAGVSPGVMMAQTVDVNVPGSLTAAGTGTGTTTPANGAIWNLKSAGIFLSSAVTLPANGTLTIDGDGHTLTLNNGAASYGRFTNGSNLPVMLDLSDVVLTGGKQATDGGAISVTLATSPGLTINTSGTVGFDGNVGNRGGSIYSFGPLMIDGSSEPNSTFSVTSSSTTLGGGGIFSARAVSITADTITLSSNTAGSHGGAINANGAVEINGALILSGNLAQNGNGGGILTNAGDITVNGSVLADGNSAKGVNGIGGAFYASNGNVTLATTAGDGNVVLINNTAAGNGGGLSGGAVAANGNVSIGNKSGLVLIGVDALGNAAGNTSLTSGGAIYAAGTTTLTGSAVTLSNNSVTGSQRGGAVYSIGALQIYGALTMDDNEVASGYGGGLATKDGDITVVGSVSADGNTSLFSGGAIHTLNGNVDLATGAGDGNVVLTNNSATRLGGGVVYRQHVHTKWRRDRCRRRGADQRRADLER